MSKAQGKFAGTATTPTHSLAHLVLEARRLRITIATTCDSQHEQRQHHLRLVWSLEFQDVEEATITFLANQLFARAQIDTVVRV